MSHVRRAGPAALVLTIALLAAPPGWADPPRGVKRINGCTIHARAKCPGANLAGTDLSGLDMSAMDLHGANLSGAHISGTNLRHAHLQLANLDGAHGSAPRFDTADLAGASLKGAMLPGASFADAELHGANLHGAHLLDGNFERAGLKATMFTGAHLGTASFRHAIFDNTHFRDAHVDMVHFWPSNFDSDHSAVTSLFIRLDAHVNAYGGNFAPAINTCSATRKVQERIDSDSPQGVCQGTAESYRPSSDSVSGFGYKSPVDWEWKTTCCQRDLTVIARGGEIKGIANGDWADFQVTSTHGLGASGHTRMEQPRGLPGGPIALYLARRDYTMVRSKYFPGADSWTGYVLNLGGWLPLPHTTGL